MKQGTGSTIFVLCISRTRCWMWCLPPSSSLRARAVVLKYRALMYLAPTATKHKPSAVILKIGLIGKVYERNLSKAGLVSYCAVYGLQED